MYNNPAKYSQMIKDEALRLGFMQCGIAQAGFLEEEAPRLENWLKKGMHGKMAWMENHFDKRLDPRLLVEGAKSVISLLLNYYPPAEAQQPDAALANSRYRQPAPFRKKSSSSPVINALSPYVLIGNSFR